LYKKYKRKREGDENVGFYKVNKRKKVPGYFLYAYELLENDEKTLYEIYKEYPSIFTRHHKVLEIIVYERDRLKKRTKLEVTWLFYAQGQGQMEWAEKYLKSYDTMTKAANYYLGLTGDKNIIYDNLHTNEKYWDLLQMFTDNHLELKVKYGYYNFLPEKQCVISRVHPWDWCNGCKPRVDDCSELLKRINRIIECSLDPATSYYTYTDCM
jgi:hypothetical protein